jgi:hypothetical protein
LIEKRLSFIEKTCRGIAFGRGLGNVLHTCAGVQQVEPPLLILELRGGDARVAPGL